MEFKFNSFTISQNCIALFFTILLLCIALALTFFKVRYGANNSWLIIVMLIAFAFNTQSILKL